MKLPKNMIAQYLLPSTTVEMFTPDGNLNALGDQDYLKYVILILRSQFDLEDQDHAQVYPQATRTLVKNI